MDSLFAIRRVLKSTSANADQHDASAEFSPTLPRRPSRDCSKALG
jgi:hypothetical protein